MKLTIKQTYLGYKEDISPPGIPKEVPEEKVAYDNPISKHMIYLLIAFSLILMILCFALLLCCIELVKKQRKIKQLKNSLKDKAVGGRLYPNGKQYAPIQKQIPLHQRITKVWNIFDNNFKKEVEKVHSTKQDNIVD